jgi:hypothetical protein
METKTRVLSQDMEINRSGVLFAPKAKNLRAIIAEGIQSGDDQLRFFDTYKGEVFRAMDYVIQRFHETDSGRITTGMLFDAIEEVALTYEMGRVFVNMKSWSGIVDAEAVSEENLIGIGVLDSDFSDGDPDPYMTAGGYRSWIAPAGTVVKYYLNADLSIRLEFDSNCVVDHYNNNIGGLSTGGGTKEYKLGERVEKRSVTLGREAFDKGWKKAKIDARVQKVDIAKLQKLASEFVPEFGFLFA